MSCLGVHFSLSSEEVGNICAIQDESDRLDYVKEVIEEEYFRNHPDRKAESDKAWDAMHRALADGTLAWHNGAYPLNHVVLGGERLYTGSDYIMVLETPDEVRDVAVVLPEMTEAEFRRRYFAIDPDKYGFPLSQQDFEYTWEYFQSVREFWLRAASENRYVLFTADQ